MKVIRKAKERLPKVPARQQVEPTEDRPAVETEETGSLAEYKSSIGKCFRFNNGFVKSAVEALVREFYRGAHAELALIEVTLYDHGQLKKRNQHTAFVKSLVAWRLLEVKDEKGLENIVKGITDKFGNLPKDGYKAWSNDYQNDRETCENMGRKLGDTMKYNR